MLAVPRPGISGFALTRDKVEHGVHFGIQLINGGDNKSFHDIRAHRRAVLELSVMRKNDMFQNFAEVFRKAQNPLRFLINQLAGQLHMTQQSAFM